MHYTFCDFAHEDLPNFYPKGCGIESYVQTTLEQSTFWQIRYSRNIEFFDKKVISELCWFFFEKAFRDANPGRMSSVSPRQRFFSTKINKLFAQLSDHLTRLGIDVSSYQLDSAQDEDRLRKRIAAIPQTEQFAIQEQLNPLITEIASLELDQKIGGMMLNQFCSLSPYRKLLRKEFDIWLNDGTPTAYTEKLSPANLFFMKLCQSVEPIQYKSGKLANINPTDAGIVAQFENGRPLMLDHVATRFGVVETDTNRNMIAFSKRKMHFGDWLLEEPVSDNQRVNAAYRAVQNATRKFNVAQPPRLTRHVRVSKALYLALSLLLFEESGHKGFRKEEKRLRDRLRRGDKIAYTETSTLYI